MENDSKKIDDHTNQGEEMHNAQIEGNVGANKQMKKPGGITANITASEGICTPLHNAALQGRLEAVEAFVRLRVNVNQKTKEGYTALHLAAQEGHTEVVRILENGGGNVNDTAGDHLITPLHSAVRGGHLATAKELVQLGADVKAMMQGGFTPLHTAALYGHTDIITFLLEHGAEVEAVTEHNGTALHSAALQGHAHAVIELISKGANVGAKESEGLTPLHLASNAETVKALLDHGADLHAESDLYVPLIHAAVKGNTAVVREMVKQGAKLLTGDEIEGSTALHFAARNGNVDTVKALVELGIPVNHVNICDETALHIAVLMGESKVVEELLKLGADVSLEMGDGKTALGLAKRLKLWTC